jgi:hypothetical protein
MIRLAIAVRATCLVAAIAVLASLINRFVASADLKLWLLMQQNTLPGSLILAQLLEHCFYGVTALLLCWLLARGYWRQLFPEHMNWLLFAGCVALGAFFSTFLNNPMHALLFEVFFGTPTFTGGAVADAVAAGIFNGLQGWTRIFTMSAFATALLTPLVEELSDRGILFKEAQDLSLWQVALLSLIVFCFSHYAIGGMAKVLAVAPAAILFVAVRLKTGSFLYSAASHMGVNAAALLKLQVI